MARVRTKGSQSLKEFLELSGEDKGRISNALNVNIAARKQLDLFDSLSDEQKNSLIIKKRDKDGNIIILEGKEQTVDRRGKPLSLSVEDIQIIKALSSYIPFDSPEVREYISYIDTMDGKGRISNLKTEDDGGKYITTYDENGKVAKKEFLPIRISISIPQISKDIIGDTKEASLRKISDRILHLTEIGQAQTFYVKGDNKTEKYMRVSPLISMVGNRRLYKFYWEIRSKSGRKKADSKPKEERPILIHTDIEFSSLFLYRAIKEYCPLYKQRLFDVWRGNKTEMFAILLSDLESKWRQYYIAGIKAEAAAKEEYKELKKTNKNEYYSKVAAAKKAARIYRADTITIRNRLTTDYESTRQQRSRFIPDLQRAIASLVEYGIITDESTITKDKSKALFFFNPKFTAEDIEKLLPNHES